MHQSRSDAPSWKPKLALALARQIVEEIRDREIPAGAPLMREHEMLERYGVARATLRESLRYLELQGVIEIRPGPRGGAIVQRPDSHHLASALALHLQFLGAPFRALMEVRCVIEPEMAALAARRAEAADLRAIEECLDALEHEIRDLAAFHQLNRHFHDLVALASKNPFLEVALPALRLISDQSALAVPLEVRRATLRANRSIARAVAEGDGEKAARSMKRCLTAIIRFLERVHPDALSTPISWASAL